jgi:hypothetical protein
MYQDNPIPASGAEKNFKRNRTCPCDTEFWPFVGGRTALQGREKTPLKLPPPCAAGPRAVQRSAQKKENKQSAAVT